MSRGYKGLKIKLCLLGQELVFGEINCTDTRKVFQVDRDVYKIFQFIQLTIKAVDASAS